jgi:hypothetical protein
VAVDAFRVGVFDFVVQAGRQRSAPHRRGRRYRVPLRALPLRRRRLPGPCTPPCRRAVPPMRCRRAPAAARGRSHRPRRETLRRSADWKVSSLGAPSPPA